LTITDSNPERVQSDEALRELLARAKTIAVVGASEKPWRDSHGIAQFLLARGYTIYPVNPSYSMVLGMQCFPDLQSIPESVDIVDVFRRSEAAVTVAREAVSIGAKALWLQLGVISEEASSIASKAGLHVVMDRCIAVEFRRLGL
jgi:uncharacterized protein